MATTYTGTLNAFINNSWTDLNTIAKSDCPVGRINYSSSDMQGVVGWTKVGTAEITVTMADENEIVAGIVESIDKQILNTYAEAESNINLLKEKKQQLLAITLDTGT